MAYALLFLGIDNFFSLLISNVLHLVAPFMLILGSILAFTGRRLIKLLVFFAGGLLGGAMAYFLALDIFGETWALIISIVGFVGIGLLCVAFIPIVFGISIGFLAYHAAGVFFENVLICIIVGVVAFVIGILLYNHVLSIITAIVGGSLILQGLVSLGIPTYTSIIVTFLLIIAGVVFQFRQLSK
ncbi:MAG: hypothetical protein QXI52_03280 [Nitrososphaerota archaeon]